MEKSVLFLYIYFTLVNLVGYLAVLCLLTPSSIHFVH